MKDGLVFETALLNIKNEDDEVKFNEFSRLDIYLNGSS